MAGSPGWLFNNLRVRAMMCKSANVLMPTGTTSNESLCAEINGWFRQTQCLRQSTLILKLSIVVLGKLLSHNTALYSPTARQMSSGQVLAGRVGAGLWQQQQQEWSKWARQSVQKAILPVEEARKAEKLKVKTFVFKRAQKRPAAQQAHSTPFTLPRSAGLSQAGVHHRSERRR